MSGAMRTSEYAAQNIDKDSTPAGAMPEPVLKRHRPRWLAIERVYLHGLWRASQATYRPWITTSRCEPDMEMVPKAYRQTFHVLLSSSVHPYKVGKIGFVVPLVIHVQLF